MGFRHNNVLHRNHFRKDWQRRVKTWFDQPGQKKSRRNKREQKALKSGLRPVELLRPAVRCPTIRYNMRIRAGRGFSLAELKAANIRPKEALSIGIPVDHRRRNLSEEGLKMNKDRLLAYKERLVVFPKAGGKKAKETPAVPENRLKTLGAAFPLPEGIVAEKPRELTAEEKDESQSAYRKLRVARSDARLAGKRKIRAEQKAAEESAKTK